VPTGLASQLGADILDLRQQVVTEPLDNLLAVERPFPCIDGE